MSYRSERAPLGATAMGQMFLFYRIHLGSTGKNSPLWRAIKSSRAFGMTSSGVPGGNSRLGYRRSHSCSAFQMITDFLTFNRRLCVTSQRAWYESNGALSNKSRASGSDPDGNSGLFIFFWPMFSHPSRAD